MLRANVGTTCLLVLLLPISGNWSTQAQTNPSSDMRFRWALASMAPGKSTAQPITGDVRVSAGTRLKAYISPRSQAFVYVLVEHSTGEFSLLFPQAVSDFADGYREGGEFYAPPGDDWLTLPETPGEDRVHVLASSSRLTTLEELLEQSTQLDDANGRRRVGARLAAEIRALKKRHRSLQTARSRPLPIGGIVRGEPSLKGWAQEVHARAFFAATYVVGRQ